MTSWVPLHPLFGTPRRRCRTLGLQQPLLTLAAMAFAALLMVRGLDPGSAVALSLTVLAAARERNHPARRRVRPGRRR
ncbi:hypothetical protein AB0M80_18680 [Amycolatopsis sp. NPDC051045]|uniref:hypothetical protein n=1 Tax=Amycolatopsis sp. NPDC051045 TaxID=3156922 RepID=UPI003433F65E